MGLSYADAKRLNLGHLHPAATGQNEAEVLRRLGVEVDAPASPKEPGDGMNKTESRLSRGLEDMKRQGEILDWAFEPEKFRLADRTWLRPDFRVTLNDDRNIFVEVKVAKKDGSILWTDDGAVKIKTVPELHPYAFFLAVYGDQRWTITRLPSRRWGHIHVDIAWRI